jgi:hypothetical protein
MGFYLTYDASGTEVSNNVIGKRVATVSEWPPPPKTRP